MRIQVPVVSAAMTGIAFLGFDRPVPNCQSVTPSSAIGMKATPKKLNKEEMMPQSKDIRSSKGSSITSDVTMSNKDMAAPMMHTRSIN